MKIEFDDNFKHLINSTATLKKIPKDTVVLRQGDIPTCIYYVHKGILRGFYINNDGNDATKCFACETEFACTEGLRKYGEASFSVETLEDSICIIIPYTTIIQGMKNENISSFVNKYYERNLVMMEKREETFLTMNALDRYLEFKHDYQSIENRISQAHIASFLGINASTLSRIKKCIKE